MSGDAEVREYIREAIPDWDDPLKSTARFKAFSGQRSDWDPQFRFWRDLILNIACRFNLLFISPSHISHVWFNTRGLSPLCLPHVLFEMYKAGDLLRMSDLQDPTTGQLIQLFNRILRLSRSSNVDDILNDRLIIPMLLKDKAADVVKALSETHWTASCIVTMNKFESLFGEYSEAFAVMSYLSGQGKARYISIKKKGVIVEGVKLSLSSAAVSSISSVDCDVLQLVSTVEEFQQQIAVIDKQYQRTRQSALAALRSCDRSIALRNARQLKLASGRREKLVSFLNKVEGVLHAVFDAEATKKVSETIRIGARAIKESSIDVEEVNLCLQEIDELMSSQEEVNEALGTYTEDDLNVEEELQELELHIREETALASSRTRNSEEGSDSKAFLSSGMASLKLKDDTEDLHTQGSATPRNDVPLES